MNRDDYPTMACDEPGPALAIAILVGCALLLAALIGLVLATLRVA